MEYILVRGGSTYAPNLAKITGARYGIRYDYPKYDDDVYMLDCGLNADFDKYLKRARDLRPHLVMTPDYYKRDVTTLHSQILQVGRYGQRVMVCPKFRGALDDIPNDCIIALSVPTPTYAGFLPDLRRLAGRDIHLLGGNLANQINLILRLNGIGANVVSVDGSYFCMAASRGRWFDGSSWQQSRGYAAPTRELEVASLTNIIRALRNATDYSQPVLI